MECSGQVCCMLAECGAGRVVVSDGSGGGGNDADETEQPTKWSGTSLVDEGHVGCVAERVGCDGEGRMIGDGGTEQRNGKEVPQRHWCGACYALEFGGWRCAAS